MQHSTLLELCDSSVSRRIAVERDRFGSAMSSNGSSEEPSSSGNISMFTQQEIDREPLLIDCTIQISPSPADLDVSLVNAPRRTGRSGIMTPELLELRDVALNPSQDCCMRDNDSSLGHHLDEVAVAQLGSHIPADAENND